MNEKKPEIEIDLGAALNLLHGLNATGGIFGANSVIEVYSEDIDKFGTAFKELPATEPNYAIERLGTMFDLSV